MKVLIVGYGSIGRRHARLLDSFEEVEEVHVVSRQVVPEFTTFGSLSEIEDLVIYDYFVIASASSMHMDQLKTIDREVSGKVILVEKPLCMEPDGYSPRNRVLVAYNLRFHPVMDELRRQLVNQTVLSVIIQVGQYLPSWRPDRDYRGTYSARAEDGGGVLLDLSHELDYLTWLFGAVSIVHSINDRISDLDINSEDIAVAIGRSENGAIFTLSMDYLSMISKRILWVQTKERTIEADFVESRVTAAGKSMVPEITQLSSEGIDISYIRMHESIILGHSESGVPARFDDGMNTVRLIQEMRRA